MKKIGHSLVIAGILITIIFACTNPSLQDFTEIVKTMEEADQGSKETIHRENYFIFSIYTRSGRDETYFPLVDLHQYKYLAIFGRFYLQSAMIT